MGPQHVNPLPDSVTGNMFSSSFFDLVQPVFIELFAAVLTCYDDEPVCRHDVYSYKGMG